MIPCAISLNPADIAYINTASFRRSLAFPYAISTRTNHIHDIKGTTKFVWASSILQHTQTCWWLESARAGHARAEVSARLELARV